MIHQFYHHFVRNVSLHYLVQPDRMLVILYPPSMCKEELGERNLQKNIFRLINIFDTIMPLRQTYKDLLHNFFLINFTLTSCQ